MAKKALARKTGARGLRSIVESALLDTMYDLPSLQNLAKVIVDENVINLIMTSLQTESSYEVRTGQYSAIKYLRSVLYGGYPEEPCFASPSEA